MLKPEDASFSNITWRTPLARLCIGRDICEHTATSKYKSCSWGLGSWPHCCADGKDGVSTPSSISVQIHQVISTYFIGGLNWLGCVCTVADWGARVDALGCLWDSKSWQWGGGKQPWGRKGGAAVMSSALAAVCSVSMYIQHHCTH